MGMMRFGTLWDLTKFHSYVTWLSESKSEVSRAFASHAVACLLGSLPVLDRRQGLLGRNLGFPCEMITDGLKGDHPSRECGQSHKPNQQCGKVIGEVDNGRRVASLRDE